MVWPWSSSNASPPSTESSTTEQSRPPQTNTDLPTSLRDPGDPAQRMTPPSQGEPTGRIDGFPLLSTSTPPTLEAEPPPRHRSKSRDEQAHEDLLTFLHSVEESYKTAAADRENAAADADGEFDDTDPNAPTRINPTHIYPVKLSCTLLFDSAFHCSSPLGQFLNVYRYGTFRPCNRQWSEFMWCMRTNRSFSGVKEREDKTLKKCWERERDRLVERGGTSEEVWERRRWMLKDAFADRWGPAEERRGDWADQDGHVHTHAHTLAEADAPRVGVSAASASGDGIKNA